MRSTNCFSVDSIRKVMRGKPFPNGAVCIEYEHCSSLATASPDEEARMKAAYEAIRKISHEHPVVIIKDSSTYDGPLPAGPVCIRISDLPAKTGLSFTARIIKSRTGGQQHASS